MSARDRFHHAVRQALQKEQWIITHDLLRIEFGEDDTVEIDCSMDRLEHYRQCIQKLLLEYCQGQPLKGEFKIHPIFDQERDHYLIIDFGWDNYRRIYNCVMHLNIQNNKIWIQRNQTDQSIAEELVSLGIPKEDIILGVQPRSVREYTGYSVDQE